MSNNTWQKNTMETVLRFALLGGREPKVYGSWNQYVTRSFQATVTQNVFRDNIATAVLDVSTIREPQLKGNTFNDPKVSFTSSLTL